MQRNTQFILGIGIFALVGASVGVYAYAQSRDFLRGPSLTITAPENGGAAAAALVTVSGVARNISYLTLNDAPIFADSAGVFSEKLLLLPGYNILTVKAEDRFGKKVGKGLELVYKPTATSSLPVVPAEAWTQNP